jgi:FKBP-type peptidyl-prolyl cis-trans isomerase 2
MRAFCCLLRLNLPAATKPSPTPLPPPRHPSVGGLAEGLVIELSNGRSAVVLEVNDDAIKLDANNLGAGKTLVFELEVLDVQRQDA